MRVTFHEVIKILNPFTIQKSAKKLAEKTEQLNELKSKVNEGFEQTTTIFKRIGETSNARNK